MELTDEKVKDWLELARQSGKQENSGLVADLKRDITSAVREQVIITVNGHIRDIKTHLERIDLTLENQDVKFDARGKVIDQIKSDLVKNNDSLFYQNETLNSIQEQQRMQNDTNEKTQPLITLKEWIYAFFKGVVWLCGIIVALGGAYLVIHNLFK